MKNNKKIISMAVSTVIALSSLTVFASDSDIYHKDDKVNKYTTGDAATLSNAIKDQLVLNSSSYFYESNSKLYTMTNLLDAYTKSPEGTQFTDYLEANYPGEEVAEKEKCETLLYKLAA